MIEIPKELLEAVAKKIKILLEAIEKDPAADQQISFRMQAATGTFDSSDRGEFQVIVELCVDENYFIKDGDIDIITDATHSKDPYKTIPPEDLDESSENETISELQKSQQIWQREYINCRQILNELVQLKIIKDKAGKTDDYSKRQPVAWDAAREFLKHYIHY